MPLCIVLFVRRSRDLNRIQKLETEIEQLKGGDPSPPSEPTPEPAAAPEPEPPSPQPSPIPEPDLPPTSAATGRPSPFTRGEPEPTPAVSSTPKFTFSNGPADTPARTTPPEETPPPQESGPSGLIAFLRSIGIWPPEESASAEAGLMQWWLPRIGGLLATLSVISFAVYISQGTPSWVRFLELVAADAAVLGLAAFFFKRRPKFGAILLSTGLSMVYLTSIAAYAAAPVRVIYNPYVGIAIQFAVVAVVFLASLRLGNRNIAIMALVYGFVSSLFSSYAGLMESALLSALALYIVGIVFSRKFDWLPILSIATVGAYLPVFSFGILEVVSSTRIVLPELWSVIAYLLVGVSLLPAADLKWNLSQSFPTLNRLHILNTSLCLLAGYIYTSSFTNELVVFYGRATIVFAAWAVIFARRDLRSFLFQLFFLKAGALAALWVAYRFENEPRWFGLIIEAVLFAWIAVRSKSLLQEIACLLLWLVSLGYASAVLFKIDPLQIGAFDWFLYLAYPLIASALLAYLRQARMDTGRLNWPYHIAALVNGITGIAFVTLTDAPNDVMPLIIALYGLALSLIGLVPRLSTTVAATSGALSVLAANMAFLEFPDNELTFLVVAILTAAFAIAVARANPTKRVRSLGFIEFVFHFAWITTVFAYTANAFQSESFFVFFPAVFTLLLLIAPVDRLAALRDAALVPLFIYALLDPGRNTDGIISALAIVAYLAVLYLPIFKPDLVRGFRFFRLKRFWRTLHHWLVAMIAFRIAFETESWLQRVLVLLLLAVAFHFLWRMHKRFVALFFSAVSLCFAFASIVVIWDASLESSLRVLPWAKDVLIGGLLTTLIAIAYGVDHAKSGHRSLSPRWRTVLVYAAAAFSFVTIATTLSTDLLWNKSSYTSLMALVCLLLVGIGIGAQIKPFRIVALVGFALPLSRLFIVDIRDTLTRIIAFAILAALLTFIGYLYHRFQSRID